MLHQSLLPNKAQCEPHFDALAVISRARVRSGFKVLVGMVKVLEMPYVRSNSYQRLTATPKVCDTEPAHHAKLDRNLRAK